MFSIALRRRKQLCQTNETNYPNISQKYDKTNLINAALFERSAVQAKSTSVGGQLAYNPDNSACDAGTLATALLSDTSSGLEIGTEEVSLADAPTKLQGFTISRTINVDPDNSNLIRISYTTDGGIINVEQNASMTTPAQGWCA